MFGAHHLVTALVPAAIPRMGAADICQWIDADGVRHYANVLAEVPAAPRHTRVVVR